MREKVFSEDTGSCPAAAMTLAAAGCGGKDTGSGTTGGGTAQTADAGTESSAAAGTEAAEKGKEVTIRVMAWDRGNAAPGTTTENNALTKWIQEQVKELYNINVEYVSVPRSESDDKLNIMMSGGTAPDIVFTYDQSLFYSYASSGALNELTDAYNQYGSNIQTYCGEAQDISMVGDQKFAVMKQRGTEEPRHMAYIRKDWLDELGMEMPTTKEELGEYLYAVKEKNLGGSTTIPWAMSGRNDTEKMYLNFLGSYVDLPDDRTAYTYSETFMAVAPGAEEGLKQLNQWYNDGLITKDFPTDTAEDVFMAAISNGSVGFLLDDPYHPHASFEILNNAVGHETFVPVQCFDLPDGSYRTPFEYRYAMFVMIPSSANEEKVAACMKYLNWMADPEVALNIRYTPEHKVDDLGVAVEPTEAEKNEKGYPGTCDDLCIMNLNFEWANDPEILAQTSFNNQATEWASLEWYQDFQTVKEIGKFRFPVYSYITEDEQTYGTDVKTRMVEFVYRCIVAPADQFDATYESGYNELVNAGLQKILDGRMEYFDSMN
ncbi:MAG: extracellular solute-binding protein [Eisenbergiella sp.]